MNLNNYTQYTQATPDLVILIPQYATIAAETVRLPLWTADRRIVAISEAADSTGKPNATCQRNSDSEVKRCLERDDQRTSNWHRSSNAIVTMSSTSSPEKRFVIRWYLRSLLFANIGSTNKNKNKHHKYQMLASWPNDSMQQKQVRFVTR